MTDHADKTKRPASQYYWGDWWKDKGLHSCSLAARGLWHEMNCLMHEGEPYGHLTLNGRPMTTAQLANQSRISAGACKKLLEELEAAGVPSRTSEGVIFSRRMVRDERTRNARAAGGKEGAEHGVKGGEHGAKGGRPTTRKGGLETPLNPDKKPPPSSSSSSSSSSSTKDSVPDGTGGKPPKPPFEQEKSELWGWFKTTLVEQQSAADVKAAGVLAGGLAQKYGNDVFLDAARASKAAMPGNLHTYFVALCETAAGKRVPLSRNGAMTDAQREAANEAATEEAMRRMRAARAGGDFIDADAREVPGATVFIGGSNES